MIRPGEWSVELERYEDSSFFACSVQTTLYITVLTTVLSRYIDSATACQLVRCACGACVLDSSCSSALRAETCEQVECNSVSPTLLNNSYNNSMLASVCGCPRLRCSGVVYWCRVLYSQAVFGVSGMTRHRTHTAVSLSSHLSPGPCPGPGPAISTPPK